MKGGNRENEKKGIEGSTHEVGGVGRAVHVEVLIVIAEPAELWNLRIPFPSREKENNIQLEKKIEASSKEAAGT